MIIKKKEQLEKKITKADASALHGLKSFLLTSIFSYDGVRFFFISNSAKRVRYKCEKIIRR